MAQGEASTPRSRSTSPPPRESAYARPTPKRLRGCFTCGEEGHFARECPKKDSVLAYLKVARKTEGPIQKKQRRFVKRAPETQASVDGTFPVVLNQA